LLNSKRGPSGVTRRPEEDPLTRKIRQAGRHLNRLVAACTLAALILVPVGGAGLGAKKPRRDIWPPVVAIGSPIQTTAGVLAVSGIAGDNIAVARVDVSLDGGAYQAAQGTSNWSAAVDTTNLSGTHVLTARATDTAGNTGTATSSVTLVQPQDTTPPTATFSAPSAGSTVSGAVGVAGRASDNVEVARVELRVDGGPYATASGTTSWSAPLNASALTAGDHVLTARATDTAGNTTLASETVTVAPADTTPPTVAITSPTQSATLSATTSVTGTAADDVSVASVAISLDGGAFQAAQGTTSWTYALDTKQLANGSHTLAARAIDGAGKLTSIALTVNVSNPVASSTEQMLVTPEGVTITVAPDVAGWTPQQVYDLLKPNAYQLELIGPGLTIKVQTLSPSQTVTSTSSANGVYTAVESLIYLRANGSSNFDFRPDAVIAHEYGHAWTMYHLYTTQNGSWDAWLRARNLVGDTRLDSSYNWTRGEMIADDYRMLFGTPTAVSQLGYINTAVADPRNVPGFRDFFFDTWA
jgi:Bacterial Ig domain